MILKLVKRKPGLRAGIGAFIFPVAIILFIAFALYQTSALSQTETITYFSNTEYELNIYRITGRNPGPTMMIIGGIHNEPGGYLTADQLVEAPLETGSLILVPRANFETIITDERGITGDMNRLFHLTEPRFENDFAMEIVLIIKKYIAESDIVLNLHDGSGFYRYTYIDNMHQPLRPGQSIISDTDVYEIKDGDETITLMLGEIGRRICEKVNKLIENSVHHFRYNNHNTLKDETLHIEQRRSATYYALTRHNIPAFGVETSKNISDPVTRVRYQVRIVNAFMDEVGIVKDAITKPLSIPKLKFVSLSVNDGPLQIFSDGSTVIIKPGDNIKIAHIEANYDRGLSADIVNYGWVNDFSRAVEIDEPTSIIFRKDSEPFGEILVETHPGNNGDSDNSITSAPFTGIKYFLLEVNGYRRELEANGITEVIEGDIVKIVDTVPTVTSFGNAKIDLKGYVPKMSIENTGNDKGEYVDTAVDLLANYSIYKLGKKYPIQLNINDKTAAQAVIKLVRPKLDYLILSFDNGNNGLLKNGETYTISGEKSFRVTGLKTNIPNNLGVKVNVAGFSGRGDAQDFSLSVNIEAGLLSEYSVNKRGILYPVEVSYKGTVIGISYIKLPGDIN